MDNDELATAEIAGVVLSDNVTDGYGQIVTAGPIVVGASAAPTIGHNYMASSNAGKIAPDSDMATGDWISSAGHCTAAGTIWVNIKNYRIEK